MSNFRLNVLLFCDKIVVLEYVRAVQLFETFYITDDQLLISVLKVYLGLVGGK